MEIVREGVQDEDPHNGFRPCPGKITTYHAPSSAILASISRYQIHKYHYQALRH